MLRNGKEVTCPHSAVFAHNTYLVRSSNTRNLLTPAWFPAVSSCMPLCTSAQHHLFGFLFVCRLENRGARSRLTAGRYVSPPLLPPSSPGSLPLCGLFLHIKITFLPAPVPNHLVCALHRLTAGTERPGASRQKITLADKHIVGRSGCETEEAGPNDGVNMKMMGHNLHLNYSNVCKTRLQHLCICFLGGI